MDRRPFDVVTGAFGYSGRFIAHRLLDRGRKVVTLTGSPERANPFRGLVEVRPFHFDDPDALAASLRGTQVLYNTYWVRFDHDDFTHGEAVENTLRLFRAATAAGIRRVVHTSITRPSEDSPLPYFRGKAFLERRLVESGLSHAIVRPAVLFGHGDILINNIAWTLRRFPLFGVFGRGDYHIQPMHVEDFADLLVQQGNHGKNVILDAVGPEKFTYRELVACIGRAIGRRRPIVPVPTGLGWLFAKVCGVLVGDVVLTRDEIKGLMADLLHSDDPPTGTTRLSEYAEEHAATLGVHYASELARRRDRRRSYDEL